MADITTLVEEAKGRLPDFGRACAYGPDEARIKTGLAICEMLDALAEAHQAEIARLTRENEGLAKDAARYRWLRDMSTPGICAFYLSVGKAFEGVKFARATVDEAIDAQIAALAGASGADEGERT